MSDVLSLSAFVEFTRAAGLAVLATASTTAKPEAALLAVAVTDSGELVVDIVGGARKLANIERNEQVALVIGWDGDVSIQVEGRIRLVEGDERRAREQTYLDRFPDSRVADPAFAVAVITPDWIRRYDASTDPPRVDTLLDTGDARIAYTDEGHGQPVLLLHGSLSADWFAPVAKLLVERGYRVLRPHRAGYGHSTDRTRHLDVPAHAAHAAAVLTASGVTGARVVGHSSGAAVALELARTRPDLVGSLVLLEAAFPYAPDEPKNPAMPRAVAAARAGDHEAAFDLFLGGVGGPDFRDVFVRELGLDGLRGAIDTAEYFFTAESPGFGRWSFGPAEQAGVTAPVLLVVGGAGERLGTPHRARSAQLAAGLPHATMRVLPGVGHLMPLEDPTLVAATIAEFVGDSDGRGRHA